MSSHQTTRKKLSAETDTVKATQQGFGNEWKHFSSGTHSENEDGLHEASTHHEMVHSREECSPEPMHLSHFYCDNATLLSQQPDRKGTKKLPESIGDSKPEHKAISLNLDDRNCSQFIDNDDEYDEMEEEDMQVKEEKGELTEGDRFANQFLHVDIPATGLKDVSRVKKDTSHDRIHKKKSIMGGLQRAVSSVKISDRRRSLCQTQTASASSSTVHVSSESRGRSGLRRAVSLHKAKFSEFPSGMKQKGVKPSPCSKQGINEANTSLESASVTGSALPLPAECPVTGGSSVLTAVDGTSQNPELSVKSAIRVSEPQEHGLLQRHRESNAQKPSYQRQSLRSVGRILSKKKQVGDYLEDPETGESVGLASGMKDRPRTIRTPVHQVKKGRGRISLHQVGRSLSLTRRKASIFDENNSRGGVKLVERDTEYSSTEGKRSSLQRISRVMSFSNKTWNKKDAPELKKRFISGSSKGKVEETNHYVHGMSDALQEVSFKFTNDSNMKDAVSTSTFLEASSLQEREKITRETNTSNLRGEARVKVKAVGRMFSFSRHGASRSRTVLRADEQGEQSRFVRAQSAPPRSPRQGRDPENRKNGFGTAGKFYYAEITSERVKRSGQLQGQTHITVPIIVMSDYTGPGSRSRWHTDVFVLPHNAVRMECLDLYDILVSMAQSRRDADVSVNDINNLEEWWNTANDLFNFYFEIERRVLFPWVESADSQDWDVQTALEKMRSMKHKLQEHLAGIERVWNEKTFKTEGEMFALVYKAVDNFVPRLMNYFSDQEVLLPAIVQSSYNSDERLRIDREVAKLLVGEEARKNIGAANHRLVLLIRWMTNAKQVRAWTGRNLNNWARNMYPKWYNLFESQHLRIVKAFRGRCNQLALI